jgi:hypothetical protein
VNGIDRVDLFNSVRSLLDGKTLRAADEIAGEVLDGLVEAGWTVTRAPEPPLRRILLTVLPDGTPVETVELRREETVANEG